MIRLELARSPAFPDGSSEYGYLFRAPLDGRGLIDLDAFHKAPELAEVRRDRPGAPDVHGYLLHKRSGWTFSYGPGDSDDEPLFHLDVHPLRLGDYVSVAAGGGEAIAFEVKQCAAEAA